MNDVRGLSRFWVSVKISPSCDEHLAVRQQSRLMSRPVVEHAAFVLHMLAAGSNKTPVPAVSISCGIVPLDAEHLAPQHQCGCLSQERAGS